MVRTGAIAARCEGLRKVYGSGDTTVEALSAISLVAAADRGHEGGGERPARGAAGNAVGVGSRAVILASSDE